MLHCPFSSFVCVAWVTPGVTAQEAASSFSSFLRGMGCTWGYGSGGGFFGGGVVHFVFVQCCRAGAQGADCGGGRHGRLVRRGAKAFGAGDFGSLVVTWPADCRLVLTALAAMGQSEIYGVKVHSQFPFAAVQPFSPSKDGVEGARRRDGAKGGLLSLLCSLSRRRGQSRRCCMAALHVARTELKIGLLSRRFAAWLASQWCASGVAGGGSTMGAASICCRQDFAPTWCGLAATLVRSAVGMKTTRASRKS